MNRGQRLAAARDKYRTAVGHETRYSDPPAAAVRRFGSRLIRDGVALSSTRSDPALAHNLKLAGAYALALAGQPVAGRVLGHDGDGGSPVGDRVGTAVPGD